MLRHKLIIPQQTGDGVPGILIKNNCNIIILLATSTGVARRATISCVGVRNISLCGCAGFIQSTILVTKSKVLSFERESIKQNVIGIAQFSYNFTKISGVSGMSCLSCWQHRCVLQNWTYSQNSQRFCKRL